MSDLEVEVAAWRRHSTHVGALREELEEARVASHRVRLGVDAFGVVGALVVGPALAPLEAAGRFAIELLDDALHACSRGAEEVADLFDFVDTEVWARFEDVRDTTVRVAIEGVEVLEDLFEGVPPVMGDGARALAERLAP